MYYIGSRIIFVTLCVRDVTHVILFLTVINEHECMTIDSPNNLIFSFLVLSGFYFFLMVDH